MTLDDAVELIREKLANRAVSPNGTLWALILTQIADRDSFDGAHADTILDVIQTTLRRFDDGTIVSLWRETEIGMAEDPEDLPIIDCVRMDLEMELLQRVTSLAWAEARSCPD